MSKHEEQEKDTLQYKDTLNLPRTDFPIRAQSNIFDPQVLARWKSEKLGAISSMHNKGKTPFYLYDGPPYANGHIHLGHAYNKILKDIVTKSERMSGKHVPVIPLWDCHGLPIEIKVTAEVDANTKADKVALKQACRAYAQKWATIQQDEFEKLGVLMHWEQSCLTMDPVYEAQTLRAFGIMVERGYIARKQKTVPWCMHCQTVLANAEIEYEDRKDPSIYVQFALGQTEAEKLFGDILPDDLKNKQISLLIWTTTPWTLPLNRAVVVKPGAIYQLVEMHGKLVILGKDLVSKVASAIQAEAKVVAEFVAEKIIGQQVQHPFVENLQVPVLGDAFVSLEDGTACVHSAPGCGPDDYEIGVKNGLEIYSPITIDGKYSSEIAPAELAGMSVADGQIWVIKKLVERDMLLHKSSIRHSYPHCWRCHNGLIFRATQQWFCDLSQHNLRERALQAITKLRMIPETGRNRLAATVGGRLEWCLSRQRTWGVPIPAVSCLDCNDVQLTLAMIESVAHGVEQHGIEYWDQVTVATLMQNQACKKCGGRNFKKESDILDVWFDSGVSHFAMLSQGVDVAYPADIYLEGKDQHRGWFQSSLLTSLALHDEPCMREILTHGFTVDDKGRKMSKSIGNVVTPDEIINKIGLDGLRLWVASNDYDSDPVVSDNLVNNVAEVYRKIRNTCRGLLLNLYDFNVMTDAVSLDKMLLIDQCALTELHALQERVVQAYHGRKTTAVFHELADYCVKNISSFYLDIVKDRLYVEKADGLKRRSAQTACYYMLDAVTKLMAPILSVTAELISDQYQKDKKHSIHLQDFADLSWIMQRLFTQDAMIKRTVLDPRTKLRNSLYNISSIEFMQLWDAMRQVRTAVLKSLETLRAAGQIRHSLDAAVTLCISKDFAERAQVQQLFDLLAQQNQSAVHFLQEYCIVSQMQLVTSLDTQYEVAPGLYIHAAAAQGDKCARCWQWQLPAQFDAARQLCGRCSAIVK